jgi:plastocyanin
MAPMPPVRRARALLTALAAASLGAGLAVALVVGPGAGRADAAGHTVAITAAGYSPATLTIAAGDSVTWRNDDTVGHTATADDSRTFNTFEIPPGESATVLFTNPGRIPYHDQKAAKNRGTLIVQAAVTTSTSSSTTSTTQAATTSTTASTTSTSSTTTSSTTTVTFPLDTLPEESTTTSSTDEVAAPAPGGGGTSGGGGDDAPTGPGIVAALLLLGTSGAAMRSLRRATPAGRAAR